MRINATTEHWQCKQPFAITGHTFDSHDLLIVTAERGMNRGVGEGAGVYYHHETPTSMKGQVDAVAEVLAKGIGRLELLEVLPAGGARNAVDAALWDLEAKVTGKPVWALAGLAAPRPVLTTYTVGAGSPSKMAADAVGYKEARAIKLKLTGTAEDPDRVREVRRVRPDAWLMVDANQGFTPASFDALMPVLIEARVGLIEQPFPIGREADLDGLTYPIPIAADESVQDIGDLDKVIGRVQAINIKLDKCGGLTRALQLAEAAKKMGFDVMVGCMFGTSISMAPGFVLAQVCRYVDLDSPIGLKSDRKVAARYENGLLVCPDQVWGAPTSEAAAA